MTLKKRIALIASGIVVFAIAAPIVIFFARGFKYDFENRKVVKTGTLTVKTDPRGADVFLDDKKIGDTPLTARFLKPGEYSLEIKKADYFSWKKRITVREEQATYVPQAGKISLLLQNQPPQTAATTTLDIFSKDTKIYVLRQSGSRLEISSLENGALLTLAATSTPDFTAAKILDEKNDSEFLVSGQSGVKYISPNTVFSILPDSSGIKLGTKPRSLLGLNKKNQLVEMTSDGRQTIVKNNVLDFSVQNGSIYYLANTQILSEITSSGQDNILSTEIPVNDTKHRRIIVSPDKQIFMLLDKDLYEVTDGPMRAIGSNVDFAFWDNSLNALLYGNNRELWIYQPQGDVPNRLITRSSAGLGQPVADKNINYAFFSEDRTLKAFEIGDSGQNNIYTLASLENPPVDLAINSDATELIYLDSGKLKVLSIR